MTQEEKARNYDEAYKKVAVRFGSNVADEIFLKESEDERIRKWIRKELESKYVVDNIVNNVMADKALAWLEKQGEQKSDDIRTTGYWNVQEVEQKPAWSEEDKRIIDNLISQLGNLYTRKLIKEETKDKYVNWFKSIKERVQPKQEWSEEDEYCRHQLIVFCENCMVQDAGAKRCAHWLKSLRPQNWKPSDEQMDALRYVTNFDYGGYKATLVSLYEQLKKLKG